MPRLRPRITEQGPAQELSQVRSKPAASVFQYCRQEARRRGSVTPRHTAASGAQSRHTTAQECR